MDFSDSLTLIAAALVTASTWFLVFILAVLLGIYAAYNRLRGREPYGWMDEL